MSSPTPEHSPAPGWQSGCAFPDGVYHDHGYEGCHQATARQAAQAGVVAFLEGIANGSKVALCGNGDCRTLLFVVPAAAVGSRFVPVCPTCGHEGAT